jgi:GntR family transcriptional regulator, transcriptional repressor for pyruvate dehydrogenase complex
LAKRIYTLGTDKYTLKPLRKVSVSVQVFEQMKSQILKGAWKPGDKIPSENELCKMLGVSRISIREALQKLVALDLLATRHGEGTFVKELGADLRMNSLIPMMMLSTNDIIDVLEYRRISEVGVVGLVADRADAGDIEELRGIVEKMKDAKGDIDACSNFDLEFHLALARMTRNPIIIKVNFIIMDILSLSMIDIVRAMGTGLGIFYHTSILDAIERRDKREAQRLTDAHILSTIEAVLKGRK